MRRTACITILAIFISCGIVHAGPVLLSSYEFWTNGGGAPEADPRVELVLQLPTTFPSSDFFGLGMGMDVFWEDGDQGVFDFALPNTDAFSQFASRATDGENDLFMLWTLFPSGGGDGNVGTELELFDGSPDLVGYNLEFVRLIVDSVSIDPWIPDPIDFPETEGFKFDVRGEYEFYGTGVPEPGTLSLLLAGVGLTFVRRRRRSNKVARAILVGRDRPGFGA